MIHNIEEVIKVPDPLYVNKYGSIKEIELDKFCILDKLDSVKDSYYIGNTTKNGIIDIIKTFFKLGSKDVSLTLKDDCSYIIETQTYLNNELFINRSDTVYEFRKNIDVLLYINEISVNLKIYSHYDYVALSLRNNSRYLWPVTKHEYYDDIDFILNHYHIRMIKADRFVPKLRYILDGIRRCKIYD